jgi:hypothetical protein
LRNAAAAGRQTIARLRKRPRALQRYAAAPVPLPFVGALVWSLSTAAFAAPTFATDGEPCSGASLEARVGAIVVPERLAAAALEVHAHLRRGDDGQWLLDLEIDKDGDASLRQLVAPQCETVLDAAAFVVAVAIDPSLAGEGEGVLVEPEPEVPTPSVQDPPATAAASSTTPPAASTTSTPAAPPPPPRKRSLFGLARAGGGIDGGAMPRVGAMLEGAVGVGGKWFRLEATGLYRLQTMQRAVSDPTVGGRFTFWAFGARGCGVPRWNRVEFPLCAGLEGGRMVAQGFGLPTNRTVRSPWGAVTFGPGLAWKPHKNIALVVQAALGVPFVRTRLTIENLGTIHKTGPVFGRAWIGFEGRFP